jgi:hypothetical protein
VQKKEKDRILHENVLDVQDPCFFGQLFAWPRWHAGFSLGFSAAFSIPAALPLRPRCLYLFFLLPVNGAC